MDLFEFLNFHFVRKALLTGILIALSCSLLGVVLVLRKMSLIGDGLAHVTFGGIAVGLFLQLQPIYVAIPIVVLSSVGIWYLTDKAKLLGDAAIGVVSSVGIAAGVVLASVAGGFNVDLLSYLFGNILAVSDFETVLSAFVAAGVLFFIVFKYRQIMTITFDEEFAATAGINIKRLNILLAVLTAVTVVLTIRVVGVMLTSALLILPAVTSIQVARGFVSTLVIAVVVSIVSVVAGIFVAFFLDLPAGAAIVLFNFCLFLLVLAGRFTISLR